MSPTENPDPYLGSIFYVMTETSETAKKAGYIRMGLGWVELGGWGGGLA